LAEKVGGSAAEDQEATTRARLIHEDAQAGKELRTPVDFVHHDEALQGPEGEQRVHEEGEVLGTLEIEERGGVAPPGDELAREGGLADLAWAEDGHDRELA
jgi:hypothetical protein